MLPGEFVEDRREGGGVFKWADDTEYAGEWKADMRSYVSLVRL